MNDRLNRTDEVVDPSLLHLERFPRSAQYDLDWMLDNEMGPNAIWLVEELTKHLPLTKGSRVLDMGCGRGGTSVFLAREYDVRVWANDLWVSADDNWIRVVKAGQQDRVCPIRAEAHNLPYAKAFFDTIVSVDSYQYYGTDDGYLSYITRFLANGGRMGLVIPALMAEIDIDPPSHFLKPQGNGAVFWDHSECWTFHTLDWWVRHFKRSTLVEIELACNIEDGWKLWRDWEKIRNGGGFTGFPSEVETLEADRGRYIGFVMLVVKKRPAANQRFDHSLQIRL